MTDITVHGSSYRPDKAGSENDSINEKKADLRQAEVEDGSIERARRSHTENDLHRGLKARQISMIAIGGAAGTGLLIGSGPGLAKGGPVGLLLAFMIMGAVCFGVMASLGEMATYLPHKKGFSGYASRFVDPAMGLATGWNYLFKYLVVAPNNVTAASIVVQYWTRAVPIGAWITIYIVTIVCINFLGIKAFGEIEFWLSFFKIIVLSSLIILGFVIDLGGVPGQERLGFRYWREQPFSHYLFQNDTGVFLGVWSCMTTALFAYMGSELVGVTFGEAKNPRMTIPATIRRTFWRILVFYVGSIFVVGLIVSAKDPDLLTANRQRTSAAASPFVVAIRRANIKILPDVINASILLFVLSAADSDLYIGSRTLHALAVEGKAPRFFIKTNRMGVPYVALTFCSASCCLAYMNAASSGQNVDSYFTSLISFTTIFGALMWLGILISHIRFMQALKVQGISRDTLPYKAPYQPYMAYTCLAITSIVTLFKGFDAFTPHFTPRTFVTNYLGLAVYVSMYFGWKFYHKTSIVPLAEVDLVSGRREIDEDEVAEAALEEEKRKTMPLWKKIWEGA